MKDICPHRLKITYHGACHYNYLIRLWIILNILQKGREILIKIAEHEIIFF